MKSRNINFFPKLIPRSPKRFSFSSPVFSLFFEIPVEAKNRVNLGILYKFCEEFTEKNKKIWSVKKIGKRNIFFFLESQGAQHRSIKQCIV